VNMHVNLHVPKSLALLGQAQAVGNAHRPQLTRKVVQNWSPVVAKVVFQTNRSRALAQLSGRPKSIKKYKI
jgi:hypothetical protein